jgi:hypothetical protein
MTTSFKTLPLTFWLAFVVSVTSLLAHASIWTGALPEGWIATVAAWNNIVSQITNIFLTMLLALSKPVQDNLMKLARWSK